MSKLNGTDKISKKDARRMVYEKLSNALGEYRGALKEKKVARNLKKLSKLLAQDIVKSKRSTKPKVKSLKNKTLATPQQPEQIQEQAN